jgi:hypothetical protein
MNMRKRGLLPVSFLLFLSASLIGSALIDFSGKARQQDQSRRPEFYARAVVREKKVQNAKDALGAPDNRYAEIPPGVQLGLIMEKKFVDSGMVVCKGETDYGLEGFFHIQDTQDERQNYAWIIIHQDPFMPNRFLFFPGSYIWYSDTGVNMIRITNVGTKTLFVDAVIGYGKDVLTTGALLGHSRTKTSLIYSHTDKEKIRVAVGKLN